MTKIVISGNPLVTNNKVLLGVGDLVEWEDDKDAQRMIRAGAARAPIGEEINLPAIQLAAPRLMGAR